MLSFLHRHTYFLLPFPPSPVIPAKAGIQRDNQQGYWIPAFAGMTEEAGMTGRGRNDDSGKNGIPKSLQLCRYKEHEYIYF